jgi:hypothetical protein
LESLGGVSLDLLGGYLVLSVDPPSEDVLLLEELLLLLEELLVANVELGPRFLLQALGFSQGDRFLSVIFEP